MPGARRVFLVSLVLASCVTAGAAIASCGSNGIYFAVYLVTDFVPGTELGSVRVDVEGRETADAAPFFSRREAFVVEPEDDLIRGETVAQMMLPQRGHYEMTVVLIDRAGKALARRTVGFEIRDAFVATVLVSRGCVGVRCPGEDDALDETVCLSGRCVTPECAADPEHCPEACRNDGECASPVACARGRCVRGECLLVPVSVGEPGACAEGEICDRERGCTIGPAACEEGETRRCERQMGVCAGASVRCTRGIFPDCGGAEYGARFEPIETLCDGLDNDCDGATDEMPPSPCPLQVGVCAGALRTCGGREGWLACDYITHHPAYEPIEQTCDGLDNDCDGRTDEAAARTFCPLQDGACARSRARCVDGSLVCGAEEYGPDWEPDETRCDGIDNDCDRVVDEALERPPCALTEGVCAGARRRCGGALGFLACTSADYGPLYEPVETRCDGLDNDCDGVIDENITRTCDRGCGEGVETCVAGEFVGCDAPTRTTLRNVTLATGEYRWSCLDVPAGTETRVAPGSTLRIDRQARVAGALVFEGRGSRVAAEDVLVVGGGRIVGGEITLEATREIRIEATGLLDAIGRFSGGGGGACSALSGRGVSAGGGGGSDGGNGGRGGGCRTTAGMIGGGGAGGGTDGEDGCSCPCSTPSLGGTAAGGAGAAAPAGAGGGGGAGGAGGAGGSGAFPNIGWVAPGGAGGAATRRTGVPTRGGGGGGGAGAEIGVFEATCGAIGGGGGGVITLRAPVIVNLGRIAVDGGDGGGAGAWTRRGASGGGGAGAVIVVGDRFENVGIVTANGGRGGRYTMHATTMGCLDTSAGGGGGGGGGLVWLDVATLSPGSLDRISVAGGEGGTVECSSPPGARGEDGIRCCARPIAGCPPCTL